MIMTDDIYYNEPQYESAQGTPTGERANRAYANIVRYGTVRHAMLDILRKPPRGFETVVQRHFYLLRETIRAQCAQWVAESGADANYSDSLVLSHNHSLALQFATSPSAYRESLVAAVGELMPVLDALDGDALFASKTVVPSGASNLTSSNVTDHAAAASGAASTSAGTTASAATARLGVSLAAEEATEADAEAHAAAVAAGTALAPAKPRPAFDVAEADVTNRWSRYIGAMGLEAVRRQAASCVLVCGLDAVGAEVAKNLVLSGAREVAIFDPVAVTPADLAGQFLLRQGDVGRNRAAASLPRLQELNAFVPVVVVPAATLVDLACPDVLRAFAVVVACGLSTAEQARLDDACRAAGAAFVAPRVVGLAASCFVDVGDAFACSDPSGRGGGEPLVVVDLDECSDESLVVATSAPHELQVGDTVCLLDGHSKTSAAVASSEPGSSQVAARGLLQQVAKVESPTRVRLCDPASAHSDVPKTMYAALAGWLEDARAGHLALTLTILPMPETVSHASLATVLRKTPALAAAMHGDFAKEGRAEALHMAFLALDGADASRGVDGALERDDNVTGVTDVTAPALGERVLALDIVCPWLSSGGLSVAQRKAIDDFALVADVPPFPPLAAYVGGVAAHEVLKIMGGKHRPLTQLFYTDALELVKPKQSTSASQGQEGIDDTLVDAVERCVGREMVARLAKLRVFLVGAGAVGCELLKNFAMLGVAAGEGGRLTLTDPDLIENSNLNRQFLFRERHLRKPKAAVAAAVVGGMNPRLRPQLVAHLDKVHAATEDKFDADFFADLDVVTNALDNVAGRLYVDERCTRARVPLLEPGTLGTRGHVQVIIPGQTETYAAQADPVETTEVPYCTLRMFPEEPVHCVEWARDKFAKLFDQQPGLVLAAAAGAGDDVGPTGGTARTAVRLLEKKPATFADCVAFARRKFQKYFAHDPRQLLLVYPRDATTRDGKPFWAPPKRPPQPLAFDPTRREHQVFIAALAFLRATEFGLETPSWSQTTRVWLAKDAAAVPVHAFEPSTEKAQAIAQATAAAAKAGAPPPMQEGEEEESGAKGETMAANGALPGEALDGLEETLAGGAHGQVGVAGPGADAQLRAMLETTDTTALVRQPFEKDDDGNHHVDAIWALSALRAECYGMAPLPWLEVRGDGEEKCEKSKRQTGEKRRKLSPGTLRVKRPRLTPSPPP